MARRASPCLCGRNDHEPLGRTRLGTCWACRTWRRCVKRFFRLHVFFGFFYAGSLIRPSLTSLARLPRAGMRSRGIAHPLLRRTLQPSRCTLQSPRCALESRLCRSRSRSPLSPLKFLRRKQTGCAQHLWTMRVSVLAIFQRAPAYHARLAMWNTRNTRNTSRIIAFIRLQFLLCPFYFLRFFCFPGFLLVFC